MSIPFKEQLENALRENVICPVVAQNSALTFAAREALRSATGIDLPFNRASNAIQASLCPLPANSPVPPIPPGGQCPVVYRVEWTYSREQLLLNGDWELRELSGAGTYMGPLSFLGIFVVESSQGSPCGTANRRISYRIQRGDGQVVNLWSDDEFNCGPFTGGRRNIQPGSISVRRVDNQPDNCGNSTNIPNPLPFPSQGLSVPSFSLTSSQNNYQVSPKILVPFVNVKGELNIPVNVTIEGINVNFNLDVDVNFNVSTGGAEFNFGKPSDTRDPGKNRPRTGAPNSPINVSGDADKAPKRKQHLIGVIVTVSQASLPASLTAISLPGGTPTVVVPYLGYVNFLYEFANGDRSFSPDIPVKNRRQFIPAPEPVENVIDVKGSGNRGLTLTLTPIYKNFEVEK